MKKTYILLTGLIFITLKNQSQTVTDYDGHVYDTVMIGNQAWLKENLRTTHYNNGVAIPNVTVSADWAALFTGARCYYNNDSLAYDSLYGPLYNWYAVYNTNNLCPSGWHVPTNTEWIAAETYLGGAGIAGGKMKESGTLHWKSPNTGATNSTGFTGLPGGMRDPVNGNFLLVGENGLWWTSTPNGPNAWSTYMWYLSAGIDHNPTPKKYGLSVRCIKDLATSLEDKKTQGTFKLYPNPSTDRFLIECSECQDVTVMVYNLFGDLVMQKVLTTFTTEFDISTLPNGVYILKATGGDWNKQQKLIKK